MNEDERVVEACASIFFNLERAQVIDQPRLWSAIAASVDIVISAWTMLHAGSDDDEELPILDYSLVR